MIDHARERVKAILDGEKKNPLPENTEKILKEIMEEAGRKLNEVV
jgi:hypothetical protein